MLEIERFLASFSPYYNLLVPDDEAFAQTISRLRDEWKMAAVAVRRVFLTFRFKEADVWNSLLL